MKFDSSSLYNIQSDFVGVRHSLFELATWKNGLAFKKINFSETGVPVIKIAELNNGIGGTTSYTQQSFPEDVHLHRGDLLFSWSGNPQTSIDIFRFNLEEGWLNQHIFKVTPNKNLINGDYFYFLMKNLKPHFTQIATNKQTTGLGHITIADIKRMNVVIPSLSEQRRIVAIIKPVDDKIELNNRINDNLEQQAQELFSNFYERATESVPFTSIIQILGGGTPKTSESSYWNGDIPFFTPKDVGCPYTFMTEKTITEDGLNHCNSRLYPVNTIFVTARGTVGKVGLSGVPMAMNQSCYALVGKDIEQLLVYFYTLETVNSLKHKASGAVFDAITTKDFDYERVMCLSKNDSTVFLTIVSPIFKKILSNCLENKKLAELRDSLLPKLMSGEIDVSAIKL
ncbi:restriction endonuclease subunit S [Akkermansia muciniphila]|uniref:Restriction endonuclease subunit S n=2 Tax=Akkermansia muciniphila TaxID=239935 RepID=A0AAP8T8V9_9BACT|nr:restriction endonuclease subunit S [Akkermansia muciniphila]PNC54728.1 restriction endonuclease subunit S [Akkermansia muciniphila]